MIIKSVEIRNFRSIVRIYVGNIKDLNIIVGPNDIGKSNFLKALNLFFNGETEIGRKFRFSSDFSKYANVPNKKAREVFIKIVFNTSFQDYEITWIKKWRNNDFIQEIFNQNKQAPNAQSGGWQWVRKIQYRYIPAIKGSDYFQYLLAELHDSLAEASSTTFKNASDQFVEGISELMRDLTKEMDAISPNSSCKNEVSLPTDLRDLFATLNFSMDYNGIKTPLDYRGDGIKARQIPIILKFIADLYKSIHQPRIPSIDTIWGYEEPENNMELTTAFKAADQFFSYSHRIQIFINTHSPAFYQLGKYEEQVSLFNAHQAEENNKETHLDEISAKDLGNIDLKMGLLPIITPYIDDHIKKIAAIEQTKNELETRLENMQRPFIITEGKSDWKHIKAAMQCYHNQGLYEEMDFDLRESDQDVGDSTLYKLLKSLSELPHGNKIIGIFDCDSPTSKKIEAEGEFKSLGNNVFAITLKRPHYRHDHNGISIEHLYTDEDLKIEDQNGRRIYLTSEFNELGILKTNHEIRLLNYNECIKNLDAENSKVIEKEVSNGIEKNVALTKENFATNVMNAVGNFSRVNFEGFIPTFDRLNIVIRHN